MAMEMNYREFVWTVEYSNGTIMAYDSGWKAFAAGIDYIVGSPWEDTESDFEIRDKVLNEFINKFTSNCVRIEVDPFFRIRKLAVE